MPIRLFTISEKISVLIRPFAVSKNTIFWFWLWVQCKPMLTYFNHPRRFVYSGLSFSLSLSTLSAWFPIIIFLSLFLIKSAWSFCKLSLIDNKRLRTHLLFHWKPAYNILIRKTNSLQLNNSTWEIQERFVIFVLSTIKLHHQ